MRPPLVAGGRLQRVADRVAVVQRVTQLALFLRIALDHRGLQTAGAADDPVEHVQLAGEEAGGVTLDLVEVRALQHDAVLDDLGQARAKVAQGERAGRGGIDDDQPRLVEGADEVLGLGMIDGRLAADRGVHLGQHGRGQGDEVHAAHVGGGHEARQVAHGAAAEAEHRRGPVEARRQQPVPALLGHRQGLGRLAFRDLDHGDREAGRLQTLDHRGAVQPHDRGVGHQRRPAPDAERAQPLADGGQRPGLDDDGIGMGAEVDGNDHDSPRPAAGYRRLGSIRSLWVLREVGSASRPRMGAAVWTRTQPLIAGARSGPGPRRWWRPAARSTG